MAHFTWLQIGNLAAASEVFPGTGSALRLLKEDLPSLHEISGPWHAAFFLGDLVPAGSAASYVTLEHLSKIWDEFPQRGPALGSRPAWLTVPGNHDLERPAPDDLAARLLRFWSEDESIRHEFWSKPDSPYRLAVERAFASWKDWTERGIMPWLEARPGLLPGDYATTLPGEGVSIGVVGLNTAFLALHEEPQRGRMALDQRQLEAVCRSDVEAWLSRHDANLLLTHHPPSWLDEESQRAYYGVIASPGHFVAHLFDGQRDRPHFETGKTEPVALPTTPAAPGYAVGRLHFEEGPVTLEVWLRDFNTEVGGFDPVRKFTWRLRGGDPRGVFIGHKFTAQAQEFRSVTLEIIPRFLIERLEIRNFKNLGHLELDFDRVSGLPGHWTCLAGINGSGKTSVLQALCLGLLGSRRVPELGGKRLERIRRLVDGQRQDTELRLWLREGQIRHHLELKLRDDNGNGGSETGGPLYRQMLELWERLADHVIVSYGVTRNLSDEVEQKHREKEDQVRRQMTLFDPLTQVASAEALLLEQDEDSAFLPLFSRLVQSVFGENLGVVVQDGQVRFTVEAEPIEALELPDGFRSSLAWLADLCSTWADKHPESAHREDPSLIEGIVLLDEIDLHLHPSLQRSLVPRLRKALPRVQWIVTTHSPLVLGCFDSAEIIALDRNVPDGVRELDRQILGFSVEEIYRWLMHTSPTSGALEDRLDQAAEAGETPEDLALVLEMSPDVDEDEARRRLQERRRLIAQLDQL